MMVKERELINLYAGQQPLFFSSPHPQPRSFFSIPSGNTNAILRFAPLTVAGSTVWSSKCTAYLQLVGVVIPRLAGHAVQVLSFDEAMAENRRVCIKANIAHRYCPGHLLVFIPLLWESYCSRSLYEICLLLFVQLEHLILFSAILRK